MHRLVMVSRGNLLLNAEFDGNEMSGDVLGTSNSKAIGLDIS